MVDKQNPHTLFSDQSYRLAGTTFSPLYGWLLLRGGKWVLQARV